MLHKRPAKSSTGPKNRFKRSASGPIGGDAVSASKDGGATRATERLKGIQDFGRVFEQIQDHKMQDSIIGLIDTDRGMVPPVPDDDDEAAPVPGSNRSIVILVLACASAFVVLFAIASARAWIAQ